MTKAMSNTFAPYLTLADPADSQEGALDPLGLYTLADSLAIKLCPGVRERQTRPRWLTVIAAGLVVCDGLDGIAPDGVSEPWQVFEWHVVEGITRHAAEADGALRMPGLLKAKQAIKGGTGLCAATYLKTPSVFGFHGVYRLLSKTLDVESNGRIGDFGLRLIQTWEKEQGLPGFHGGNGPGNSFRMQLRKAVEDGLAKGEVIRSSGWAGWQEIWEHFNPGGAKVAESSLLMEALLDYSGGCRGELLQALKEGPERQIWDETRSERAFHSQLLMTSSPGLKSLLTAVGAYETWARHLQDAFDECRYALTRKRGRMTLANLAELDLVASCHKDIRQRFDATRMALSPFAKETAAFEMAFQSLAEGGSRAKWVDLLLQYHRTVQRQKPPAGKAPWLDRFDDGSYAIRAAYRVEDPPEGGIKYVHAYRTASLVSFLNDLVEGR